MGRLSQRDPREQRFPVDRITFPHFRPVGWYWNGELHYMSDQPEATTNDYPNPGELHDDVLSAPPPELNDEAEQAQEEAVALLPEDDE